MVVKEKEKGGGEKGGGEKRNGGNKNKQDPSFPFLNSTTRWRRKKKEPFLEMDYQNNNNPVTKKSIYSSHQ